MVKIIADTISCLPIQEAAKRGIYYIPQIIVFGEQTYRDDTEMNSIEFLRRQKVSPVLPKTAAPPPALYKPIYQELTDQGHTVLVIAPSSQISGTVRGATVAANDFPGKDIRVIDTKLVAGGLGAVVIKAKEWADQGMEADEIISRVMEMSARHRIYFAVDTLEFLYKGGRIGAASALVGSLLQMKPILTFREGTVQPFERHHTHRKAIARIQEIVQQECPMGPDSCINFMHGDAEEEARTVAKSLAPLLNIPESSIPIYDLTPAILTHSGPGVIAVSFFVK
jgi:DegV family protein with EDD domain